MTSMLVVRGHVILGHVMVGHVIMAAGGRRGDAHLDAVVPLQTEQTAHQYRHISTVWTGDAGDVQLTVGGRVTSVSWLVFTACR